MSDWSGQGLPPAAQARMDRARQGGPASSLLSINGQAGLEGCGFHVVGEVMGCIVEHIGWDGYGGCGYYGQGAYGGGLAGGLGGGYGARAGQFGMRGPVNTVTSSGGGGYTGFGAYADALYSGYDTALFRMLSECQALGGDGVVGVTMTVTHLGNDNREFLAYGTAVRAHSETRPRSLFSTLLAGQDVAKLLHGGWTPVGIVVGLSIAIRHDDWTTMQQASMMAGNTEVSGYSELVHHVRSDARKQFQQRTAAYGADGAVSSSMDLDVWEREAGENHRDHVALASMTGTAIARFHKGAEAPTSTLKILPLETPRRSK
ncbi:MAG: heavy metal-binding domain-containing protein [Acidimicrobiales bacterium]